MKSKVREVVVELMRKYYPNLPEWWPLYNELTTHYSLKLLGKTKLTLVTAMKTGDSRPSAYCCGILRHFTYSAPFYKPIADCLTDWIMSSIRHKSSNIHYQVSQALAEMGMGDEYIVSVQFGREVRIIMVDRLIELLTELTK